MRNAYLCIKDIAIYERLNPSFKKGSYSGVRPLFIDEIPKGTLCYISSIVVDESMFGRNTNIHLKVEGENYYIYKVIIFDDIFDSYFVQSKASNLLYGGK